MSTNPKSAFEYDWETPADVGSATRSVNTAVEEAVQALLRLQHDEGWWAWELEADCTIPAEYILMTHFMGEPEEELEGRIAGLLRAVQLEQGGWPLYHGGDFDMSCSVKVYYALKLCGDDPQAPHMRRAREAILAHGGAARSNVFTRITLALFGQIPWRGVPFLPVEHMLLPRWFPFHISKISYWSRTVLVPLAVLCSVKPAAVNQRGRGIAELFTVPAEQERHYFRPQGLLGRLFLVWDRTARLLEPLIPRVLRARALRASADWLIPRLNGVHGLGCIFPAMVNAYEALGLLGYAPGHPYCKEAREALRKLLVRRPDGSVSCQPCVSPVWDTSLGCLALAEADPEACHIPLVRALDWLRGRQVLKASVGDWREKHPDLAGGGWAFQFSNNHYPDLDSTPVVAWAMRETDPERYREPIAQAAEWVHGMQSRNGGYGSFDSDNTCYYLNYIPFADHGALLDPPTSDVTARCLVLLGRSPEPAHRAAAARALNFLWREQEEDGSWFGRWGTNYIYGTWSVLSALEQVGVRPDDPRVRRAAAWLKKIQNTDGSWGESNDSYIWREQAGCGVGTPFQTAWALLGLLACGEAHSEAVCRGVEHLLHTQQDDGLWNSEEFTAPGFPRVFYLRYHGYSRYFPLWALGRYRRLVHRQTQSS